MVFGGIFQNSWRTSIHQISDWKKDNLLIIWSNMNPDIKLFKYLFSINLYFSRLSDKTPATKKLNNLSCGYTQLKSLFVTEFMFLVKFVNSICYSLIAMVLDPLTFPNFCHWLLKFKKVMLITFFTIPEPTIFITKFSLFCLPTR